MSTRTKVHLHEQLLANSGMIVDAAPSESGRSVVAYDPKQRRAFVFVDGMPGHVDESLKQELRWLQHLADRIPQDELPASHPDAKSTPATRGTYAHGVLEGALTFGWDSPTGMHAQRLLQEVVVDKYTGVIIDWNVAPSKASNIWGTRRSIDVVALREGVTAFDIDKRKTRIQDVIAASIDYKTGGARLHGVAELKALTGAPVVRLYRGGDLVEQLRGVTDLIAPVPELPRQVAVEDVLARHPNLRAEVRDALRSGRADYVLSNGDQYNAMFSRTVFSRGYLAFDVVSGGIFSSLGDLRNARRQHLNGQAGFATIGGALFALVSVGGLVYVAKDIDDIGDLAAFVGENVAGAALGAAAVRLAGARLGLGIGFLLTMEGDGNQPTEEEKQEERKWQIVDQFLHQHFADAEISAAEDDLRQDAYALLFETVPRVLDHSPVGRLTVNIMTYLEDTTDGDRLPYKRFMSALLSVMRLRGTVQMQDILEQKPGPDGGTYYDLLIKTLEGLGYDKIVEMLPPPEAEEPEPPAPAPAPAPKPYSVAVPDDQWAVLLPDGTWSTRPETEVSRPDGSPLNDAEEDGGDTDDDDLDDPPALAPTSYAPPQPTGTALTNGGDGDEEAGSPAASDPVTTPLPDLTPLSADVAGPTALLLPDAADDADGAGTASAGEDDDAGDDAPSPLSMRPDGHESPVPDPADDAEAETPSEGAGEVELSDDEIELSEQEDYSMDDVGPVEVEEVLPPSTMGGP